MNKKKIGNVRGNTSTHQADAEYCEADLYHKFISELADKNGVSVKEMEKRFSQYSRLVGFNDYARKLNYHSMVLEKMCDDLREKLKKETNKDVFRQLNTTLDQLNNLSSAFRKTAEDFFEKVETEMRKYNVFDKETATE